MDKLLNKNIFDERDLCKLSPDYRPVNVLLRMQLRRSYTKDTHNHGVHKHAIWSRKSVKRPKDCLNIINKEIIQLRNEFKNINVKNRMTLKCWQPVKYKPKINNAVNEDPHDTNFDENVYLHEFFDDSTHLEISNNAQFQLISKDKPERISSRKFRTDTSPNQTHNKNYEPQKNEDVTESTIFKVECISNFKKYQPKIIVNNADEYEGENFNKDNSLKNNEMAESDLQKLLIMMALSSKPKVNEEILIVEDGFRRQDEDLLRPNSQPRQPEVLCSPLECSGISNILSITPFRIEISLKEKTLAKKFIKKWKHYVQNRKKYVNEQRQSTLNNFLDKLAKKKMAMHQTQEPENKARQSVRDYSTYQHRYKVQRHIIALQKAKLEEQNRMIEELKYNKIVEASQKSVDAMREEVRKTYYEIDRQLKPKIKCLTNELKMHEIEEPSLVLHCLKVPQFLQRMEKRAREREEKHAMIRERRKQMEEERIRLKQQAEIAKAEMDKEEKLRRMKELREKRKREKIDNIRRKQYTERMRALTVMADLHYEKTLTFKYGIRPLRILIEIKRDNLEKAKAHYAFQLKKNIFLHWMWHTEDMWYERNYQAENLYRKKILRRTLEGFKMNHFGYILKKQVAEDYYDIYITQLVLRKFREGLDIIKKENEVKWQKAEIYHSSNLLFKTFTSWRTLPALNSLKREQEARKARWREKVLQVVPDYKPLDD